jgi:hypothetical protein
MSMFSLSTLSFRICNSVYDGKWKFGTLNYRKVEGDHKEMEIARWWWEWNKSASPLPPSPPISRLVQVAFSVIVGLHYCCSFNVISVYLWITRISNEYDVSIDKVESSHHFLPPRSGTMTQQEVLTATATAVINISMQVSMSYITVVIIVWACGSVYHWTRYVRCCSAKVSEKVSLYTFWDHNSKQNVDP